MTDQATFARLQLALRDILREHLADALTRFGLPAIPEAQITEDDTGLRYQDCVLVTYTETQRAEQHGDYCAAGLVYEVQCWRFGGNVAEIAYRVAATEAAVCSVLRDHMGLDGAIQRLHIGNSEAVAGQVKNLGAFAHALNLPVTCFLRVTRSDSGDPPDA
jgi:hypothetical protein